VDNWQGARLAVEYLLALGHRRVGYIGAADRPKSNEQRLAGYQTALKQAGLPFNPAFIISSAVGSDFERGWTALETFLTTGVTAIFCYNDVTAIGLLTACHEHHLPVPQKLSIIGFDDIESALYVLPPLTTLRQPRLELGQLAMLMALDLLNGQASVDKVLPCELIVRQSTASIS